MQLSDFEQPHSDVNGPALCPLCGETVAQCGCPLVQVRRRKWGLSPPDFAVAQHLQRRRWAQR